MLLHVSSTWKCAAALLIHNIEEDLAEPILKKVSNLAVAEKMGLWALRHVPKAIMESPINPWAKEHTDPEPPAETFRQYYRRVIKPMEDKEKEEKKQKPI